MSKYTASDGFTWNVISPEEARNAVDSGQEVCLINQSTGEEKIITFWNYECDVNASNGGLFGVQ
jgi:hypothetical protein